MGVGTRARLTGRPREEIVAERAARVPLKGHRATGWDIANAALFLASDEALSSLASRCRWMAARWFVSANIAKIETSGVCRHGLSPSSCFPGSLAARMGCYPATGETIRITAARKSPPGAAEEPKKVRATAAVRGNTDRSSLWLHPLK